MHRFHFPASHHARITGEEYRIQLSRSPVFGLLTKVEYQMIVDSLENLHGAAKLLIVGIGRHGSVLSIEHLPVASGLVAEVKRVLRGLPTLVPQQAQVTELLSELRVDVLHVEQLILR